MKKKSICLLLSIMLVFTLIPQISFAAEETAEPAAVTETTEPAAEAEQIQTSVITGFVPLETSDYYYEGNPDEGELTLNLPETLGVYLDGSAEPSDISVSWESVEDYDNTDFYYYSMKPVWGSEYVLSDQLSSLIDVPWITVYKQEPENEEIEPILTEEEIEPVYTEEEGPVDPEAFDVSEAAEDTAKAVMNVFVDEAYAANEANTSAVYNYLTRTMGLNTAAACGVMANINAESAMSPNNLQNTYNSAFGLSDGEYTSRVDKGKGAYKTKSGTSKNFKTDSGGYGLCQWTSSGRKTNLLNNVIAAGRSVSDINCQLGFLNQELQGSYPQVYATLKGVPNTAAGAYIAAAEFCMAFEIPANTVSTAASRGKTCLSGYWKTYSGQTASASGTSFTSICGYSYPTAVKKGKGMDVYGYVLSNYNIKSVTGQILNSSGKAVYSKTVNPGTTTYKLSGIDGAMKFGSLGTGTFTYKITVTDSLGKTVTASHQFKVSTSGSTTKALGFASANGAVTTTAAPVSGGSSLAAPAKAVKTAAPAVAAVKKAYTGGFPSIPKRGYFKKGDKGTQVKKLQKLLNWCGCSVSTGGTYGTKTVTAVKKLQKKLGLKQDGKFGKKTLTKAKALKK